MKLLAVMSHKGGVGKTTSAVVLAEELAAKGYRTLLVDADRQQGAGLLLEVGPPTGEIQQTLVSGLDYLGSGRFTETDVAAKAAAANDRYDIGIVDTPAVDDDLARSWLQQATATLMIMQVEPLTVKTFPNALTTLETVRRMNPLIELVGLLPTMFDSSEATHRTCLTELLTRRPESVFTPPVPVDAGLMHRGAGAGAPEIQPAARQAYQCAADRIIRVLGPSRGGAVAGGFAPGWGTSAPNGLAAAEGSAPAAGFPATGSGPSVPTAAPAGWQPAPGASAPPAFPGPPAHPGWPVAPAPGGFAPPSTPGGEPGYGYAAAPAAFPEAPPAGAWPAPAAGFPPPAGPVGYPGHPAPAGPAGGSGPAGRPIGSAVPPFGAPPSAPTPHPGCFSAPSTPAPLPGGAFDADEQEPDWYRAGSGAGAPASLPSVRADRRVAGLPFLMGFAVACVLALLVWAFGAIRKPAFTPAQAAPSKVPVAVPSASGNEEPEEPKTPAGIFPQRHPTSGSGAKNGADGMRGDPTSPRAPVRKEG
jgi:cellulose biosynthesis protein BcsQ